MEAAEQDRRRQAQLAPRRRARAGRGPFDLLEIGEHAARTGKKPVARLREADGARGAVEKTHSEPRFEVANDAGDGGRRTSQPPRGCDETTPLGNLDEDRDGLGAIHYSKYRNNEFHGVQIIISSRKSISTVESPAHPRPMP
jgi:hypothetical protein